jgi:DNA-binding MarR family transcriptional regulator
VSGRPIQDLGPPGPTGELVRLSLRIVLHLSDLGPLPSDGVARPGATQQGMARELCSTQSAVSKILARLTAAEVVRRERRHVRGENRRVLVYSLTVRGDLLANEIQAKLGIGPTVPSPAQHISSRR